MTGFDPKTLTLGDILVFRRTIELGVPPVGEVAVTHLRISPFDLDPKRYLNSMSHVSVDPNDPSIIYLVGTISYIPDTVIDYQQSLAEEAKLRAMEDILGEDEL